jgi:hypothetical protein
MFSSVLVDILHVDKISMSRGIMYSSTSASYEPDLSAVQLDRALESLCESARRAEWLMCRYLADMAEEGRDQVLSTMQAEPDKRWSPDRLCYATELSAAEVAQALTQLELMRKICLTTYFDYALVGGAAAARPARGRGLGRASQGGARRRRPRRRVERVRL